MPRDEIYVGQTIPFIFQTEDVHVATCYCHHRNVIGGNDRHRSKANKTGS